MPAAWIGGVIVLVLLAVALAGKAVAPFDPLRIVPADKLLSASPAHLFGTDDLGRDLLSRVIAGARISLLVGALVLAIAMSVGVGLGLVAGYWGGWMDEAIMRTTDVFLAFPRLVLAIAIAATLGPGLYNAMVAVALSWWPWYTRLVRGRLLSLREEEFVLAVVSLGAGRPRILLRHLLPNVATTVVIQASIDFGYAILATASLSFIGLGAQPPTPEWGSMIAQARSYMIDAWWYPTFPGLAIFVTVLGFNLLGDAVRDAFDPRLRSSR
ncbi:MAG: ABC transporter permease [Bacillati bacterium ANGP1]|uniref:ABC transporter permease n=1 Tax=Candidatus Segetimicrobium genomatis TaxID=2569760 RepID=A0A537JCU2_9BACT|nr:MAG: ABC transporter permease [Terrabacteria group bacterium ANGP1]